MRKTIKITKSNKIKNHVEIKNHNNESIYIAQHHTGEYVREAVSNGYEIQYHNNKTGEIHLIKN